LSKISLRWNPPKVTVLTVTFVKALLYLLLINQKSIASFFQVPKRPRPPEFTIERPPKQTRTVISVSDDMNLSDDPEINKDMENPEDIEDEMLSIEED